MEHIGLKVHVWCKIDIDMMGRYLRRHHHRRWCRSIIITLAMIENPYINRNAYFTLVDIAILLQFTVCCIMMRKRARTYFAHSYLWINIHFHFSVSRSRVMIDAIMMTRVLFSNQIRISRNNRNIFIFHFKLKLYYLIGIKLIHNIRNKEK